MVIYKVFLRTMHITLLAVSILSCNQKKINSKHPIAMDNIPKKKINHNEYPQYLSKNYVLGKFDYHKNIDFKIIPKALSSKKIYLRKEVIKPFLEMQEAPKKEGIDFKIVSGTRNFEHQKRIWNYKWENKYKELPPLKRVKKILLYSSMPTTSRHHWGTDIDVNQFTNSYFSKGKGLKEYNWLLKNAHKFGFYQPYTSKNKGRTGYEEEKWHWSYKPLSKLYLNYYNKFVSTNDITGFKGSSNSERLDIIKNYVNGINSSLK